MTPGERKALRIAKKLGLFRAGDLAAEGVSRDYLQPLVEQGLLVKEARGLYMPADADVTENHTFAEAAQRIPNGIICLLSALRFHELGTQLPSQVWVALHVKAWKPRLDDFPVRIVRMSGPALSAGVDVHTIEKVPVQITTPAKTVADCFKYRNKIGLDVALEALRDYHRSRLSLDELGRYARICRVERVMRPYLEALV